MTTIVVHLRPFNVASNPRGGLTVALEKLGPSLFNVALANCHEKDNFVKSQGRAKAIGRLRSAHYAREFTIDSDPDLETVEGRKEVINWIRSHYGVH